jgi:hypothetical protein
MIVAILHGWREGSWGEQAAGNKRQLAAKTYGCGAKEMVHTLLCKQVSFHDTAKWHSGNEKITAGPSGLAVIWCANLS